MSWEFEHSLLLTHQRNFVCVEKLANLITIEGILMIRSDEFRDLERNKARCLEKLAEGARGPGALCAKKNERPPSPLSHHSVNASIKSPDGVRSKNCAAKLNFSVVGLAETLHPIEDHQTWNREYCANNKKT